MGDLEARFAHVCKRHKLCDLYLELVTTSSVARHSNLTMSTRVFHITLFFELSLVLLTTHAIGLYEVTKKIQRYRQ